MNDDDIGVGAIAFIGIGVLFVIFLIVGMINKIVAWIEDILEGLVFVAMYLAGGAVALFVMYLISQWTISLIRERRHAKKEWENQQLFLQQKKKLLQAQKTLIEQEENRLKFNNEVVPRCKELLEKEGKLNLAMVQEYRKFLASMEKYEESKKTSQERIDAICDRAGASLEPYEIERKNVAEYITELQKSYAEEKQISRDDSQSFYERTIYDFVLSVYRKIRLMKYAKHWYQSIHRPRKLWGSFITFIKPDRWKIDSFYQEELQLSSNKLQKVQEIIDRIVGERDRLIDMEMSGRDTDREASEIEWYKGQIGPLLMKREKVWDYLEAMLASSYPNKARRFNATLHKYSKIRPMPLDLLMRDFKFDDSLFLPETIGEYMDDQKEKEVKTEDGKDRQRRGREEKKDGAVGKNTAGEQQEKMPKQAIENQFQELIRNMKKSSQYAT